MRSWVERAKAHFAANAYPATTKTTKTTKTDVSPVLVVVAGGCDTRASGVMGVLGVGLTPFAQYEPDLDGRLLEALMQAAMLVCNRHGDSQAARGQMQADCRATPPYLRCDLLEHFNQINGAAQLASGCAGRKN
jgi:hypothetical protein